MGQGAGAAGNAIRQEDIKRSGSLANYRIDTDHYDQTGIINYDTNDPSYTQQQPHSEFDIASNSTTLIHRGLSNESGENNCFLNVTIQALWHLGPFRVELLKLISNNEINKQYKCETKDDPFLVNSPPTEMDKGLVHALCNIFVQYEFTELPVLPPTELRITLSSLFEEFQLGEIADATETLGAILERIHIECTPSCPHGATKCLSHTIFGGQFMEQSTCMDCGASSEPVLRSDFVHNVCAAELIGLGELEKKIEKVNKKKSNKYQFGNLLHECMHVSTRSCPSLHDSDNNDEDKAAGHGVGVNQIMPDISEWKCTGQAQVKLYTLEPSLSLAISVGWTTPTESRETLHSFLSLMSYTINLSDLFDMNSTQNTSKFYGDFKLNKSDDHINIENEDTNKKSSPRYVFRGFVCYYGLHYISIFQEHSLGEEVNFLLFDDTRIRRLGGWEDVKSECLRSLYQPVLLLYELEVRDHTKDGSKKDDDEQKDEYWDAHIKNEFKNTFNNNDKDHMNVNGEFKDNNGLRNAEYCVTAEDYDVIFSTSNNSRYETKIHENNINEDNNDIHTPAQLNVNKTLTDNTSDPDVYNPNIHNPDSHILNKHPPPISIFERRPMVYEVVLSYALGSTAQRYLGLEHGLDDQGHYVVVNFPRDPSTGILLIYICIYIYICINIYTSFQGVEFI
jgi:hypothetical protein